MCKSSIIKTIIATVALVMILSIVTIVLAQGDHICNYKILYGGEPNSRMSTSDKLMTCSACSTPHRHYQQKTWDEWVYECRTCHKRTTKVVPHSTTWSAWICDLE